MVQSGEFMYLRRFLVLILLSTGPLPGQSADADSSFQRALELHRTGNIEGAIEQYLMCLRLNPSRLEARSNLGAALARVGRYSEAIEQYKAAIEQAPPQIKTPLRLNLALAYYKTGEIPQAAKELKGLRAVDTNNSQVTLLLADCHLRMGEFAEVIGLLQPLAEQTSVDSQHAMAIRYLLGTALIRNGQIREGQSIVDQILQNSESAEARLLIAMSMYSSGDYPAALVQLKRVIEVAPGLPSVHSYYGQALLYTGDPTAAESAFRKALEQDPYDFDANLRLGQILSVRGQRDEALSLLRRASLTRPGSMEAHRELAAVYAKLGRRKEAERERVILEKSGAIGETPPEVAGPKVGDPAPEFTLEGQDAGAPVVLRDLRLEKPVLLVFGSYTCPKLRSAAPALVQLQGEYGRRVGFLLIYIREAHADGNWQSSVNEREAIALPEAKTLEERRRHAELCRRKLSLNFPAVVDDLNNRVEKLYQAWPSRAFLVSPKGTILWSSLLDELNFRPSELHGAIQAALGTQATR